MVAHHKVFAGGDPNRPIALQAPVFRQNVGLVQSLSVDEDFALRQFHNLPWKTDHSFDIALGRIRGKLEHHNVLSVDGPKPINKFIDKDTFLIRQPGHHADAFHLHRLVQEHNDDPRNGQRENQIANPNPQAWQEAFF